MIADPPPSLRHRVDLDGVRFQLAAQGHLVPRSARWLIHVSGGVLVTLALVWTVVAPEAWGSLIGAGVLYALANQLDDALLPSVGPLFSADGGDRVFRTLHVGPQHLLLHDGQTVWLPEVGRVRVENELQPHIVLQLAGGDEVEIAMEYEPVEHARWLAEALMARARELRRGNGTHADIPQALRILERP